MSTTIKTALLSKPIYYNLKNQRLNATKLEKAHFIKVNELKVTEVELF